MDKIIRQEVDMHIHSTYSDGRQKVSELVDMVKNANLKAAILTDHDRIDGLPEFIALCKKVGVDSMSGVEISSTDTTVEPQTIDVLGYGFDFRVLLFEHRVLLEHNLEIRIKYLKKVLELYKEKGLMDLNVVSLENYFGLPVRVANKYWIIAARMETLSTSSDTSDSLEIARKELSKGGEYFVEKGKYISTKEAIDIIRQSGGIAVWAHPTKTLEKLAKKHTNSEKIFSTILDRMVCEGLNGLEVFTPYGDYYKRLLFNCANKNKLIVTGGSDYHGEFGLIKDDYLGKGGISYQKFHQITKLVL